MKRQSSEWEKIIANETTDKRSLSKLYKQFMQCNIRKTTQSKMGRRPKQTFLQRRHTKWSTNMKKCSTLLIIREMQIKTTMRYHLTPVRMVTITKSINNKCETECREKGILLHCWWE